MQLTTTQLRPLSSTDCSREHFDVLAVLTEAPRLSPTSYAGMRMLRGGARQQD